MVRGTLKPVCEYLRLIWHFSTNLDAIVKSKPCFSRDLLVSKSYRNCRILISIIYTYIIHPPFCTHICVQKGVTLADRTDNTKLNESTSFIRSYVFENALIHCTAVLFCLCRFSLIVRPSRKEAVVPTQFLFRKIVWSFGGVGWGGGWSTNF